MQKLTNPPPPRANLFSPMDSVGALVLLGQSDDYEVVLTILDHTGTYIMLLFESQKLHKSSLTI